MLTLFLSACDVDVKPNSPDPEPPPMRIGYVPYWDQERAFSVVRRNPEVFDEVSPVWYAPDETGKIVLADAENTTVDLPTARALQARGVRIIPTVTNLKEGEWDPGAVQAVLHDPVALNTHIEELVNLAVTNGYDGIDIDYEDLSASDRAVFSEFLTRLGQELHRAGKQLTTAVHPKTSDAGYDERNVAQDYQAIGQAVDQVRVMTYDYSWETSPPGPVAPADWVEEVIAWTVTQVPSEKVILGIVLLGYDWGAGPGVTVDYEETLSIADAQDATVQRFSDGSPWFAYHTSSGARHEVWYEDTQSVRAKLALVSEYGLGGAFFWRLGGEDSNIWPTVREVLR
jgi:spore germination protein YaaH